MKLLKKLLPITAVAGIATIATPLVTSCGNAGGWIDGTKEIDPEALGFKKCDEENLPVSYADATVEYTRLIKNDKQLIQNDFTYWLSQAYTLINCLPEMLWERSSSSLALVSVDVNKLSARVSNVTLDEAAYKASYNMDWDIDIDFVIEVNQLTTYHIDPQFVVHFTAQWTATITDCPYIVGTDIFSTMLKQFEESKEETGIKTSEQGLAFAPNIERMRGDKDWTIKFDVKAALDFENKDIELGLDGKVDKEIELNQLFIQIGGNRFWTAVGTIASGWSTYYYSDFAVIIE